MASKVITDLNRHLFCILNQKLRIIWALHNEFQSCLSFFWCLYSLTLAILEALGPE